MTGQHDGLWFSSDPTQWRRALELYPDVISQQGVTRLPELDAWYRDEFPAVFASRRLVHITLAELIRITEWKMYRGVWRAPNLVRVKNNPADEVIETTVRVFHVARTRHSQSAKSRSSMASGLRQHRRWSPR